MHLSKLPKLTGKFKRAKRIGRGIGSGKGGHTSSRGQKGQKSRTGFNLPTGFEGGQVPMFRRMPHAKGFVNSHDLDIAGVNVRALNIFKDGDKITPQLLLESGILFSLPSHGVKILGDGDVKRKLNLEGFLYSESAKRKIEEAGGQAN